MCCNVTKLTVEPHYVIRFVPKKALSTWACCQPLLLGLHAMDQKNKIFFKVVYGPINMIHGKQSLGQW